MLFNKKKAEGDAEGYQALVAVKVHSASEMVFTSEGAAANHTGSEMLQRGKQGRQRKTTSTPRKGRTTASSNLITKVKKSLKVVDYAAYDEPKESVSCPDPVKYDVGNMTVTNHTASSSVNNDEAFSMTENTQNLLTVSDTIIQSCDSTIVAEECVKNENCDTSVDGNGVEQKAQGNVNDYFEKDSAKPELRPQCVPDLKGEVARLKQLMLLQLSLISRQQDLLRLRDREIMQLKASNQNYKCQLNRVRRRMTSKKDDCYQSTAMSSTSNSSKRKCSLDSNDCDVSSTTRVPGEVSDIAGTSNSNITWSENHKRTKSEDKRTEEMHANTDSKVKRRCTYDQAIMDDSAPQMSFTPPSENKNKIPVPLSFIDRRQKELISALLASPPDKALKTLCTIMDSPSHSSSENVAMASIPFKICDRCPHCVAIAAEVARLYKIADASDSTKLRSLRSENLALQKLSGVCPAHSSERSSSSEGKKHHILRTTVSYFRHTPTFDNDHWWLDLNCSLKKDRDLYIPTWKEQTLQPVEAISACDNTENTEDSSYSKRHSKYELDEKRRKRWDIQRIREYRYNEKLRQKLLKQAAVYDAPVIESFSGHLHDAEAVEIFDNLPVNIFGYPAPYLEPAEFSLTPMYNMAKQYSGPGSSRRKSRKLL